MLHNKDIAIISPVTLINIGLKQILTDYFSAGKYHGIYRYRIFLIKISGEI